MMDSYGMKSLLKDDHLLNRPTTAGVKYNSNTATRKRPLTASPNRSAPPWVNPNAPKTVPMKKFHVSLNHQSSETRLSKRAPFAPRINAGPKIWDQPKVVNGKVLTAPEYNSLEDPHLGAYFARKMGVKPRLSDGSNSKKKKQREKASRIIYNITVITGDHKNANTDARVFVQLRGTKGKITKQQLTKKPDEDDVNMDVEAPGAFMFKKASSESFSIRSPDIGDLIALEIEHDGIDRKQGWYLEEVMVKNQKTKKTWIFPCQSWLSLYESDCQVKRILKPASEDQRPERVVYEVEVVTGNERGAGTDAHVFLTMYGDRGNTRRVQLVNRNIDTFERGQTDLFKIKVKYLGKIQRIMIDHDNTGFAPGWFLDRVIVTNTHERKDKWYFLCNNWLSKDDGDGQISRLLLGTKSLDNVQSAHKYVISTHTGDVRGAGTDANVYITLFSKNGSSTEMKLNDSKNNFERKKVDTFNVESANIGPLTRVRIRHDNKGVAAGWFLGKVVIRDGENQTYEFPCDRWLSESEDDGQISRDLIVMNGGSDFMPGLPYIINITTGDIRGAGTSAKVYVILYGGKDGDLNSGKLWIRNGSKDNFERGRTDIFNVECAEELSPIHHVTIGHDNSGVGAGWYLEKAVIDAPTTGIEQTFFCRQWLADDEGDKLIERDLVEDVDYRKQREAKNVWNVAVHTSDIRGAGTDANVFMVLYGDKGKSEEIPLRNKTDNFERGNVDKLKVEIKEVGTPYKLRIWHDNSKMYADWHLEKIFLENTITNERYSFECNRWLGTGEDDGQCVRELAAVGGTSDPLPLIPYQVSVHTADKRGAGTDANVFINMFGERGDTGDRPLLKSSTNRNKFERKQIDEFIVEAVSLSALESIRIGHDGKNAGAGWFLDKIIVKDPTTNEDYPFLCNRWLASDEDDGQIVREIPVGDTATLLKTTSYHVGVKTGDIRGAGTDANVYLILFGDKADTGKLQLRQAENTKDKWERGRTDMFTLEAMDIGKVKKVIIGHDGKGFGAGWFLDSVTVDVPSHGQQLKFACNRWLASDEDDGLIERELYPSEEIEMSKKVPYEIEVHTGDVRGAGTDANVFVVLYGKEGKSEEFWLRSKTDNFERNEVDKFKVESDEIGLLTKLRVGHDNAGMGAAWFLDKIIVRRLKPPMKKKTKDSGQKKKSLKKQKRTGEEPEEEEMEEDDCNYLFPCNRWFAKGEDDGQIVRELVPYDMSGKRLRKDSLSASTYDVHVFTGDMRGGGTNSNVFLTIYGDQGDTGERELKKSETHFDKFERNQEDIFKIEAMSVGKISKVKIRHDNSGLQSSWYLDKVEVHDTGKNADYIFPCNRWLSKTEDDGALSRELVAVERAEFERRLTRSRSRSQSSKSISGDNIDLEQMAEKTTYNINVETGDVSGAGTDANVYIYLYGEKEDSGKIELKTSKSNRDKFERKQIDVFTAEAVDLGNLKKIRIGHDNKGGFAGWYLDNVVIDAPSMGRKWTFPAGRWLDKGKEDGKLEVDLYPSTDREEVYQKHVPYEIVVHTSDVSGAGTDSNVYIALYGMGGACTEETFLTDSKKKRKGCFNRSSVDVFVRELPDVGDQIDKIRVGHDNKGFGAAWHLDKVEVRRLTETEDGAKQGCVTFTFPCNRWLAKGEDDGAIVRELVPTKITEEAVDKSGKVSTSEHRVDALEVHSYKIQVFTGDVKKAGTDANVFITLFGEHGDTGERQLSKSETHRDKFERAQEDIFNIEAADLGYIRKCTIRHDNANLGADWFLDRVEIVDVTENERKFVFMCERWLAKKKDDGKIKRSLYEKTYEGDRSSTRSSSMSLYGSSQFNFSTNSLNGAMTPRKSHPNSPQSGRKSSVSVRSSAADEYFESKMKGKMKKAHSKTSLGAASSLGSLLETIPYTVRVSTGDKTEHSTDAKVSIVFIGSDGVSEKIPLELIGKEGQFEAGSVETFSVESIDVGEVKKIELGHDGYRQKDSWYVKNIEIDVPTTGRKYFFPCECWLGKDKEDGKTVRMFSVDESKDVVYKPKIPYQMTIYTSDVKNAGTDAEIHMTLFGTEGESHDIKLDKEESRFERNSVDVIRIDIDDVGQLTKLRIGHDGKGSRPDWFLEKVVLLNLNTEEATIYKCGEWLSKKEGDGKTVRELAAEVDGQKAMEETTYTVNVRTGDKRGGGTDANVFLIIFGENGNSGELALKESSTNKDKFERGHTDVFTFNMLSLGQLSKIRIWHDNKYMRSGWFLSAVDVTDSTTNETYEFPCERWLAKSEDDGSLMRELACANTDLRAKSKESLAVTGYEVTFVVSDKPNAGTIHDVMLVLIDVNGKKSNEILIENNSKSKKILRRGQTDTVKIASKPLGELKSVVIALQRRKATAVKNEEGTNKFHLHELIVKDLEEDTSYAYTCDQWLNLGSSKDSQLHLEVSHVEKSKVATVRESKPVQYEIKVYTADVPHAGTDANVSMTLFGENGDTGARELKKKFRNLFEKGNMDNFKIEALDLGKLTKIEIGHDNKGMGASWMLDRVEVVNTMTSNSVTFACQEWFDKKKGDKKIVRELFPAS